MPEVLLFVWGVPCLKIRIANYYSVTYSLIPYQISMKKMNFFIRIIASVPSERKDESVLEAVKKNVATSNNHSPKNGFSYSWGVSSPRRLLTNGIFCFSSISRLFVSKTKSVRLLFGIVIRNTIKIRWIDGMFRKNVNEWRMTKKYIKWAFKAPEAPNRRFSGELGDNG